MCGNCKGPCKWEVCYYYRLFAGNIFTHSRLCSRFGLSPRLSRAAGLSQNAHSAVSGRPQSDLCPQRDRIRCCPRCWKVCAPRGPGACALCARLSLTELHWLLGSCYTIQAPTQGVTQFPRDRKTRRALGRSGTNLVTGSLGAEWPRGTGSQIWVLKTVGLPLYRPPQTPCVFVPQMWTRLPGFPRAFAAPVTL